MSRQTRASQRARSPEEEGAGQRNVQPRLEGGADVSVRYRQEPYRRYPGRSYFEIRIRFHKPNCTFVTHRRTVAIIGVNVKLGGEIVEIEQALDTNGFEDRIAIEAEGRTSVTGMPDGRLHMTLFFPKLHASPHTLSYMPYPLQMADLSVGAPPEEWVTNTFRTEEGITGHVSLRLIGGDASPELRGRLPNDMENTRNGARPAAVGGAAAVRGAAAMGGAPAVRGAAGMGGAPAVRENGQQDCLSCVVCMEKTRSVLFFPCKHLCVCQECHLAMLQRSTREKPYKCPMCRQEVRPHNCIGGIFLV